MIGRLYRDRAGNFGIMTALLLIPVIGAAGLAVDFRNALLVKTDLRDAADAAALYAIASSSAGVKKALLMSGGGEVALSEQDAMSLFSEKNIEKNATSSSAPKRRSSRKTTS